jgi:hypothetical protein
MEVKRILYIAPHSFPIHSSESIVNAKLAHSLCKRGYELDLFSSIEDGYNYPISIEENILKDLPNLRINTLPVEFICKKNSIIKNLKIFVQNTIGFFKTGLLFIDSNWAYNVISDIEILINIKDVQYDFIITRGFKTEIVGIYFKRKYGIKWIANWNDPYPELKFPFSIW